MSSEQRKDQLRASQVMFVLEFGSFITLVWVILGIQDQESQNEKRGQTPSARRRLFGHAMLAH